MLLHTMAMAKDRCLREGVAVALSEPANLRHPFFLWTVDIAPRCVP